MGRVQQTTEVDDTSDKYKKLKNEIDEWYDFFKITSVWIGNFKSNDLHPKIEIVDRQFDVHALAGNFHVHEKHLNHSCCRLGRSGRTIWDHKHALTTPIKVEVLQQTIHQTICSKVYKATQSKSKLSTKIQCSLQCLSLQCPNQNVQTKTVPSSPWQSQPAIMPDTTWVQRSASSGFLHVQPESSSGHETTRHQIIKSLNDREINATINSQQSIHQQSYSSNQQWTDWTLWQLRTRLIVIRTPRTMNYNLSGKYSRQQKSIHQTTSD